MEFLIGLAIGLAVGVGVTLKNGERVNGLLSLIKEKLHL